MGPELRTLRVEGEDRQVAELRARSARLESIIQSVPGVVWEAWGEPDAASQRIDYVSPHVERMLGYTVQEWLATPNFWLAIVHPDDRERAAREAAAHFASGKGGTLQFRWRRKDGEHLWVQAWNTCILDDAGRPIGMRGVTMDITPLKTAEEALRASDERTRLIARATNDAIWDWDLRTDALWWNENFHTMFGHAPSEVTPDIGSWTTRIHPDDLARVKGGIDRAIASGAATWQDEYRFRRADGTYADILDRGFIIRDATGRGTRMVGSMMDVTATRRTHAELQRVRHGLELILKSAGEGVYGVDRDGTTTFMNPAALAMLGLDEAQAVGRKLHDVIHHTHADGRRYPAVECPIYQAAHGGPAVTCTTEVFFRADGTPFPVEYITAPIREGDAVVGAVTVFKDVTAQRRAQAQLEEERAFFTAALDQMPAGVLLVELPSGRIRLVNRRVREILGADFRVAEDFSAYDRYEILDAQGRRLAADELPVRRAIRDGAPVQTEVQYRRSDGRLVPLLVNAAPVRDASGRIVAGVTTFVDIGERKGVEEELRRQRDLTTAIMENAGSALFMIDARGHPVYMNAAARAMTGYGSVEEIRDRPLHDAIHFRKPDGSPYPMEECPIDQANARKQALRDQREVFCRKDGALFAVEYNATPLSHDGRMLGVVLEVRDITARDRAERRLQEQTERLQAAMDASGTGTFRWRLRDNTLEWDENLDRLFGLPPGRTARHLDQFTELVHPDDRAAVLAALGRCIREGADFDLEFRVVWPDGTVKWLLDRGQMVTDGEGRPRYMTGACTDITARKRIEEDLRQRAAELAGITAELQKRNAELDQFAYITSHDLKAPLRGIANLSRWIEEDLGERLSEQSREHLELLRGRVHRMEALIDAILEYSRAGRVRAKPERVEVAALVAEVTDLLSPPPGFRVEVEGSLPTLVTERMRLQQVLLNLIGNAIKHHHAKHQGRVVVRAREEGARWRFEVADDGPGIAPRFHEKIFAIFQTLEPRDKVEGTGIGLALVKKIVESHGGTIGVDSDVGRGATFSFTWPAGS